MAILHSERLIEDLRQLVFLHSERLTSEDLRQLTFLRRLLLQEVIEFINMETGEVSPRKIAERRNWLD